LSLRSAQNAPFSSSTAVYSFDTSDPRLALQSPEFSAKTIAFNLSTPGPEVALSLGWMSLRTHFKPAIDRGVLVLLIALTLASTISWILSRFEFHTLEAALYNTQTSLSLTGKLGSRPDPRIVLLTIDDSTLSHFQELSPLSIRTHTQILEAIARHRPLAVGYTLNLARSAGLEPETDRPSALKSFAALAKDLRQNNIPVVIGTTYDVTGEILPPFPLSTLPHGLALIHRDGAGLSGDKVSRRALLRLAERPAFSLVLAHEAGLREINSTVRGSFEIPEIDARYFSFRYHGDPSQAYPRVSAQDLFSQKTPPDALAGKIVLIGSALQEEPSDFSVTPFSQEPWASPKLALHATILDSLLADDGLLRSGALVSSLLTLASSALVILLVLKLSPLLGVLSSVSFAGLLFIFTLALFQAPLGVWVSTAHPFLGMLAAYYLAVPYRLLQEHQQRSRLQRSHEVLMQVEELKTNFLSLVTHDLKTPVARIQGLAEVLLMKASSRLVERDIQSLHHIVESTDELNRFISSILELAKIESAELKPRFESKDLNRLVEKAVDGFKAPARAKHCRIETELDPLFPIAMDPSLIQKVIHNLLDNAIKYSPEGSTIHVRTREIDSQVEFSVRDEGVGLSALEQEQLFQKFYRAKNSATSHVGGSGLGLYLCKYFIEAHSGSIDVESSSGAGSAFIFRLPLEQPTVQKGLKPGLKTIPLATPSQKPQEGRA